MDSILVAGDRRFKMTLPDGYATPAKQKLKACLGVGILMVNSGLSSAGSGSMKMVFRGWRREVFPHEHQVTPVVSGRQRGKDEPLVFTGLRTVGKVNNVALSGDFQVSIELSPADLQAAVEAYASAEPAEALRMLLGAQATAIIAMTKTASPSA